MQTKSEEGLLLCVVVSVGFMFSLSRTEANAQRNPSRADKETAAEQTGQVFDPDIAEGSGMFWGFTAVWWAAGWQRTEPWGRTAAGGYQLVLMILLLFLRLSERTTRGEVSVRTCLQLFCWIVSKKKKTCSSFHLCGRKSPHLSMYSSGLVISHINLLRGPNRHGSSWKRHYFLQTTGNQPALQSWEN